MTARATSIRERFRALIQQSTRTIVIPGAHDPVSAMLVQRAGFPAVYVGSYALSATLLGRPDTGLVTMTEAAAATRAIADAVDLPVLADAENGWTNAANLWRAVRCFEDAGAAGFHIEDHEFGKHTSAPPVLASVEQTAGKIRAALEARTDPNFLIIARTDLPWATGDLDEAVRRLNAYADAGADLLMPAGLDPEKLRAIRHRIRGKVLMTDTPGRSKADEQAAGADLVIYYGFTLLAAYGGVRDALAEFARGASADEVANVRQNAAEFEAFLDYSAFVGRAERFCR